MQLSRKNKILIDTIIRLVRRNASATLKNVLVKVHPADVALIMDHLRSSESKVVFNSLDSKEKSAEVLSEVSYATAAELLETLEPSIVAEILTIMASDDAAQIIADMPDDLTEEVLKLMEDKDSDLVEELLSYSEETAGRIMTPDFLALLKDELVGDAIKKVQEASDAEMVFYAYVVDEEQHLLGVISLRQLLTVSPKRYLKDIMITDVIKVRTDHDQEEVSRLVARYNLLAIPVVTDRNKLVGIITVDDIIDVISEEATEDIMRMSGAPLEISETATAIQASRSRFPWILASLIGGLLMFYLIIQNIAIFRENPLLFACIPLILALGGNIANQSATLIAQGLVSGAISINKVASALFRELRIGFYLASVYGLLIGSISIIFSSGDHIIPIGLGLSTFFIMFISAFVGGSLPILFLRMNLDPANASGPISVALVDLICIALYLIVFSF